jgi:hypothetical protein
MASPIQWGIRCKELIAVSQPADSGNRLAAIVSTAVFIPLPFKQISSGTVRQFPLSVNSGKPIADTYHKTGFQQEIITNGFE